MYDRSGRAASARRRAASAAAGVLAVAVSTMAAAACMPAGDGPTMRAVSGTTAAPSGPPPASAPVAVPLDVLAGNVIHLAEGGRVTLRLPAGLTADEPIRVPGGWLVTGTAEDDDGLTTLFFAGESGRTRRIGQMWGSYEVSADGRVLVLTGNRAMNSVEAYELPSLRLLRRTTFDSGMGPIVGGISGHRVVLLGAQGSPGPSRAAVWDLRTGKLRSTRGEIWTWGVSRAGTVLRRVDRPDSHGEWDPSGGCLDAVLVGNDIPERRSGLCDRRIGAAETSGSLSPDGESIVLTLPQGEADGEHVGEDEAERSSVLLRAADVSAGRWRPVSLPEVAGRDPLFWDTDETFLVSRDDDEAVGYDRCGITACVPVKLPAGVADAVLVPRRGA